MDDKSSDTCNDYLIICFWIASMNASVMDDVKYMMRELVVSRVTLARYSKTT